MSEDQRFKVSVKDDYIHLETWGALVEDDLDAPANAALALAEEKKIDKLLDNISNIDSTHVSVTLQAKGVGVLWKLRKFKKIAIVFKGQEIGWLFLSTLQAMHLDVNAKFKGFDNETDAIIWLKEE
jgi:hypothetical protein